MQSHNISTDSHVLHPISLHPISLHPISLHPISLHPISLHPISLHPISLHPISSLHPIFRCTQFWVHPISCTQFFAPNLCTQFFYAAPNSLHPIFLGHIFVRKNSAPNCLHPIFYSFFMHICDKIWVRHGWKNWVQAFRFTVFESNKISQKKLGAAKKNWVQAFWPQNWVHILAKLKIGCRQNWVQMKACTQFCRIWFSAAYDNITRALRKRSWPKTQTSLNYSTSCVPYNTILLAPASPILWICIKNQYLYHDPEHPHASNWHCCPKLHNFRKSSSSIWQRNCPDWSLSTGC